MSDVTDNKLKSNVENKKPEFHEFCVKVCEFELQRIVGLQRTLKKGKKEYIKLMEEFKLHDNEESAYELCKQYPEFIEMYENLDAEMLQYAEELKAQSDMVTKGQELEAELLNEKEQSIVDDMNQGEDNE